MNLLQSLVFLFFISSLHAKEDPRCSDWAESGECESNPGYMLVDCKESCLKAQQLSNGGRAMASFYDIVETDIDGNTVDFSSFRGSIVYIVNVASQCGYTAQNYETFRSLAKYKDEGLQIVIAPCNQFGGQEPGDSKAITYFAEKQSFDGIILGKKDVNGPNTRPIFTYLKNVTGKQRINWNFDGKFLCDRSGNCSTVGIDVEEEILALLGEKDL